MDKETLKTWNNIASIYQDKFMDMDLYNETYDFICNSIPKPNAKILELGCGPGNITKYLLLKRPDFNILGIDIAPNMIELAKKNNPTAKFKVMDSRKIDKLNDKYDGIVGGFCLPYLSSEETNQLILNSYPLLNTNGLLYLSFVEGEAEHSQYKVGKGGRVFFYYHNLSNLTLQLKESNFEDIEVMKVNYKTSETTSDVHTILTARKK